MTNMDLMIIALILQGGIILVLGVYIHLLKSGHVQVSRLFSEHLAELANLYKVMRDFVTETGIERILIFKTSNGGAKPELGAPLHVKCIYEGPGTSVKEKYKYVTVDEEYIRMLLDTKVKGEIRFEVENMPFCLLQKVYLAEGVKFSVVFFIHENQTSFYYGTIATRKDQNPFIDVKMDVAISLTIDTIREIFKKLKK